MKEKRGIAFVILIGIIFVLSLYFDNEIFNFIQSLQNSFLTEILAGFTFASFEIITFVVLTSFFLWTEGKRKWILPLWFTLFIAEIANLLLKITVQRLRPFQQGLIDISSIFNITDKYYLWDFSFPSGHAVLAFCTIPILSKEFPKLKWLWIILAVLVSLSRIYFGFHFLSDVIAGGILGYFIGKGVVKLEKETGFWERTYNKIKSKFMR